MYLLKLHKNFLKFYVSNLFKGIANDLNHGFHTTLESTTSLPDTVFVQIAKECCYTCLNFIFSSVRRFISLLFNQFWHIIIKGFAILRIRCLDVRGDVFAEMFWQSSLDSLACVPYHKVLLLDVASSSSRSIDPGQHNLHQEIDVGLRVEFEEDEWQHEYQSLVTI